MKKVMGALIRYIFLELKSLKQSNENYSSFEKEIFKMTNKKFIQYII